MSSRKNAKLVLNLTPEVKKELERRAQAENCDSTGDFVTKLFIEKLESEERNRLEQLLLEGINSGPSIPVNDAFWYDIERRVKERAKSAKKPNGRR